MISLWENNGKYLKFSLIYDATLIFRLVPYVQPAFWIVFPLLLVHFAVLWKRQLGGEHFGAAAFVAIDFLPSGYSCNAATFRADKYFHHMFSLTSNFVILIHSIVALNLEKGKWEEGLQNWREGLLCTGWVLAHAAFLHRSNFSKYCSYIIFI